MTAFGDVMQGPARSLQTVDWQAGARYVKGPPASSIQYQGSLYECMVDHYAGDFATDVAEGRLKLIFGITPEVQAIADGAGVDRAAAAASADEAAMSASGNGVPYDTLALLTANTSGLVGQVVADSPNNGFYTRFVPNDPSSAWVRKSPATIPSLDVATQATVRSMLGSMLSWGIHPDWSWMVRGITGKMLAGLRRADLTLMAPRLRAERDVEIGDAALNNGVSSTYIHAWRGAGKRLLFGLDKSLTFCVVHLGFGRGEKIQSLVKAGWSWAVAGSAGKPYFGVRNGIIELGRAGSEIDLYMGKRDARNLAYSAALRLPSGARIQRATTDYALFLQYGQSFGAAQEGTPRISKTARANTYMVGSAVHPIRTYEAYWTAIGSAVLSPLVASVASFAPNTDCVLISDATVAGWNPRLTNILGESPLVSMTGGFAETWEAEGRAARTWVAMSAATPGRTIEQLVPGASPNLYQRIIDAVTLFKSLVPGGKAGSLLSWAIDQGQSNYAGDYSSSKDKATYKTNLATLRTAVNADAATVIGATQVYPPAMFIWQTGGVWTRDDQNLSIGMAQWEFSLENPGVYLLGNTNIYTDTGAHPNANGYLSVGNQQHKVAYRTIVLGQGWEPPSPLWVETIGSTIYIGCTVPAPPLQFLACLVATNRKMYANKGLKVTDAAGDVPCGNVRVIGSTIIAIDVYRAMDLATAFVWNADAGLHEGNTNVFDSDVFVNHSDYVYDAAGGMTTADNIPGLPGKPLPSQNGLISFYLPVNWSRI